MIFLTDGVALSVFAEGDDERFRIMVAFSYFGCGVINPFRLL